MKLTWLTFDIDCQQGEEKSFSLEYVANGNTSQLCLYFPGCVIQLKSRWERNG